VKPPWPFNSVRDCTCGHRALPQMVYFPKGGEPLTFCCRECYSGWMKKFDRLPNPGISVNQAGKDKT